MIHLPEMPHWDEEGALWKDQERREMLWAYDFNLAFDEQFDRQQFFTHHVFGEMVKEWPDGFRERMELRMERVLENLPEIFAELPDEWLYLSGDDSLAVQLDLDSVSSVLCLPFTSPDIFWKLP